MAAGSSSATTTDPLSSAERELEITLEGRATFLNHAFETYTAVAAALRRGSADALASKAAVATQWLIRNHADVGKALDAGLTKVGATKSTGPLAHRIRSIPALQAEVLDRLRQLLGLNNGELVALLTTAARRSHLAWDRFERDWQLDETTVIRIPDGFVVTEVRKGRVFIRWSTTWIRPNPTGFGHKGKFELADDRLFVPGWLFGDREVQLNAIRTHEDETNQGHRVFSVYATNTQGVEDRLFAVPSHYDAEFICEVICHFTGARRDSHRTRLYGE